MTFNKLAAWAKMNYFKIKKEMTETMVSKGKEQIIPGNDRAEYRREKHNAANHRNRVHPSYKAKDSSSHKGNAGHNFGLLSLDSSGMKVMPVLTYRLELILHHKRE
jgi:hypothetical protein